MTDVMEYILRRRSIRAYQPREVEPEKLELLLRAAMAAPTACNSQPWEFVVVTDQEVLAELTGKLYAGHYNPAAAIAILGNPQIANNSAAKHFWVQDCSAAAENILIAAAGMDLGAVWIGVYPLPTVIKPVAEVLHLPEQVIPLGVIYVGYPAESKPPRTQYDPHRVYWQHYEPRKRRAKLKNAKYL